jgi:hypothetical protein
MPLGKLTSVPSNAMLVVSWIFHKVVTESGNLLPSYWPPHGERANWQNPKLFIMKN